MKGVIMKFLIFILILLLTSCTVIQEEVEEIVDTPVDIIEEEPEIIFYPPVEVNPPNTDFSPMFVGQTRISGIKTIESYSVSIVTESLNSPWGIDVLPNGDFVITEKNGSIRIVNIDGSISNKINLETEMNTNGQGGLLDVLVGLDFETSRTLYFTLSEKINKRSLTAVGKATLSTDNSSLNDFEIIYRAIPYYNGDGHFGSRIVFDKDGDIFVSTGDRQNTDRRMNAQSIDNGIGKILHITTTGLPVSSNPFLNDTNAHKEIFSLGHRNVQGIAVHPQTGDLWANEMGPQGGDELNLIEAGKNYGWPTISYGEEYSGAPIGDGITQKDGLEQPVYYWDPVIAPGGMIFYDSDVISEWKNNLFIGGLRSQHIIRLLIKDNKVIGEERLLENEGQRFRDISVGLDGALYAITDSGRLYRIGK
jgi:aldose sugar dehydrogenase